MNVQLTVTVKIGFMLCDLLVLCKRHKDEVKHYLKEDCKFKEGLKLHDKQ